MKDLNVKTMTIEEIKHLYSEFIETCSKFNFFTRSEEIQRQKVAECEQHIQMIKAFKAQAINKENELEANHLFHMQCMLNAMKSSLKVWLEVKNGDYAKAWHCLIDAQEYTEVALKVSDYEGIRNMERHLKNIEEAVFPGWAIYNSPGHIESIGKCSICLGPFLECNHIENQIYMGQFCQRIDREILKANHLAMVKNPKDRRCIITKLSEDNGKMVDYFTWEECGEANQDENSMKVEGIFLSFSSLDLS